MAATHRYADRQLDWEKIERDYRSGIKSIRSIASEHKLSDKAVRDRAKLEGWERDLTAKVQKEVRTQLLRETVRARHSEENDSEIIQQAAATAVEVVRGHRKSLARSHKIVNQMLADLEAIPDQQSEIEAEILEETAEDKRGKRRATMLRAVELPSRAGIIVNLSAALSKLVSLERQAFNIDSGRGDDSETATPMLDGLVGELDRLRKRIEATEGE